MSRLNQVCLLVFFGLALALAACAPSPTALPTISTQAPPTRTARPTAPAKRLPATATLVPTITPFHEPWPSPAQTTGWQRFEDAALNLTFLYPPDWKLEGAGRASGADGFFEVSSLPYASTPWTSCLMEANDPTSLARHGEAPFIMQDIAYPVEGGFGCSVVPAQPTKGLQSVLYLRGPHPATGGQTIVFRGDSEHFDTMARSLQFLTAATGPLSGRDYSFSGCLQVPKASPVTTQTSQGLTITEYALVNESCDPWEYQDGFSSRASVMRDKIISFDNSGQIAKMEQVNQTLALFGYRLEEFPGKFYYPLFTLFKGEEIVADNLIHFDQVSVRADGSDFLFWARGESFTNTIEVNRDSVRKPGLEDGGFNREGFNAVWVGNDLVSYRYSRKQLFYIGYPARIEVFSKDKEIARIVISQMGAAGSPVRGLWHWQGHWIMEIQSVLFQDGEMLNTQLGYDEIFDWHFVSGKPFFLMRRGDTFGAVYDGQELSVRYENITHGDLCCSFAGLSVRSSEEGALFYALRDGVWFLVTIVDER